MSVKNGLNLSELSVKDGEEVINKILFTNLSLNKIAKMYGVTKDVVIGIKNGKTKIHHKEYLQYPLRPNNPVSTISAKESTVTIDT